MYYPSSTSWCGRRAQYVAQVALGCPAGATRPARRLHVASSRGLHVASFRGLHVALASG